MPWARTYEGRPLQGKAVSSESLSQFFSRLFGSMKTTAKCVLMGHAHCRTRLSRHSAAAFQWGHSHAGGSRAGSGNGTRSEHILVEGGHQSGPFSRQRVWVLQPYFIVPGKDGELHPILGLSQLNRSVMRLKFRMISLSRSCLRPDQGTGCHERSRRRILPISILPPSQVVPEVCFGGKAYQYRVLPFSLALSPRTFVMCGYYAGSSVTSGHPHTQPHR